uniref:Transmembrane protein 179B n=1 Tax=Periophthalmus magnuspinnatus TaxID=409849 RepID=A0A3B3ZCK7_9GOBI
MAGTGVLILEIVLYVSCFVCGIVTAASITITQGRFAGLCVLYGLVSYNKTSESIGVQYSSPPSLCYFVSSISVIMAIVCFSLSLHCLYSFYTEGNMKRERLWMTFDASVCAGFLFFLLITGCVLKNGSLTLCNSVTQAVPNITSCEEAQSKAWTAPFKGYLFYSSLQKAETTVWVSLFLWLMIGGLGLAQRRYSLSSKSLPCAFGLSAGRILADPGVTAAETEPFFNCPVHTQEFFFFYFK